jgi:putative ABC transport system permease protein
VRTREGPSALATALLREVRALDPALAPQEVITLREQVDRKASAQRVAVALLCVFAAAAAVLAAIGLYGVMSYSVSQGARELGLRMALGAEARDLLRLVLSHGLGLTAIGIVLGAVAALSLAPLLGYLLYGVSPRDPVALGSALAVMAVASLAACILPALRAARTDPVRALRG